MLRNHFTVLSNSWNGEWNSVSEGSISWSNGINNLEGEGGGERGREEGGKEGGREKEGRREGGREGEMIKI